MKNITFGLVHTVILTCLPLTLGERAMALEVAFCAAYADSALKQNQRNLDSNCGFYGPSWSFDSSSHADWCVAQNDSKFVNNAIATRERELNACIAQGTLVQRCGQYAKVAVRQNELNLERNCGFTGPRWSSNKEAHSTWCVNEGGGDFISPSAELDARHRALGKCAPIRSSNNRTIRNYPISTAQQVQDIKKDSCKVLGLSVVPEKECPLGEACRGKSKPDSKTGELVTINACITKD